jgi:hypothetical protein
LPGRTSYSTDPRPITTARQPLDLQPPACGESPRGLDSISRPLGDTWSLGISPLGDASPRCLSIWGMAAVLKCACVGGIRGSRPQPPLQPFWLQDEAL